MGNNFNISIFLTGMFLLMISADNPWREWGIYTYFISDQFDINLKLNYTEASLYCHYMSSQLTSVHSREETDFLVSNTATVGSNWFGLHQKEPSLTVDCRCQFCQDIEDPPSPECETCASCRGADKWQWEDGTQYDWTNWHLSQPSDFNNEKCVRFHGSGTWYDSPCSKKYNFICKKEISCYPHFCNSNGICVYDTCVCNVGFTGKACDTVIIITSEVSSTPTDPTTGVSDLCSTRHQYSCECQDIVSCKGDQTGALTAVGVLFAISLIVNIVTSVWLMMSLRSKPSSRQLHQDEYVYYNSVVQSHKASVKSESVNEQKEVCPVSRTKIQSDDTSTKNIDVTGGPYEPLQTTSGLHNTDKTNTYAELK